MPHYFLKTAQLAVSFFKKLKKYLPPSVPIHTSNLPNTLRPPLDKISRKKIDQQELSDFQILLNAKNHLQFIEYILVRYPQIRNDIAELLQEINERIQDPRLYLGIIGEFNSGKSSFINALLRSPFLSMSNLPATTCVPTVLSWAQELTAEVFFMDGRRKNFKHHRSLWITLLQQLQAYSETAKAKCVRNFAQKYSSVTFKDNNNTQRSETLSQTVYSVQIGYPANVLQQGIVLIDTPGANAIQTHDALAGNLVRKFCDTCIILIPKETPASQTLLQFVKKYLKDILHHCIFVIHKTDTIPIRERKIFQKKVTDILLSQLKDVGIQHVTVLQASSQMLLDDLNDPEHRDEIRSSFVQEFYTTEQYIYKMLAERKEVIIAERIVACLEHTYQKLTTQLKLRMTEYQTKYQEISKLKIRNLQEFIQEQSERKIRKFLQHIPLIRQKADIKLKEELGEIKAAVWYLIEQADSKIKLQYMLKEQMPFALQDVILQKYDKLLQYVHNHVIRLADEQHTCFKQEFMLQYFQKLQALDHTIPDVNITIHLDCNISLEKTVGAGDQAKTEEIIATSAGAVVGGIIGTIILPGLGSIIGAGLGGLIGNLLGPSLSDVKIAQRDAIYKELETKFQSLAHDVDENIKVFFAESSKNLSNIIAYYFDMYDKIVERMIQDLEKQKQDILVETKQTEQDIQQIASHKKELDTFREHCLNHIL